MKHMNDPSVDYRLLVMKGYDQCAGIYGSIRNNEIEPDLALLIDLLEKGAKVLDIGCGSGIPIARTLAKHFKVTGVDLSNEMVQFSIKNVPNGTFIHADIIDVDLPSSEFDAIVSFYTIFHIPKERHKILFQKINSWLKDGGHILMTVSNENTEPYIEEFHGVTMYWSNHGLKEYKDILTKVGFDIIQITSVGNGYNPSKEIPEEYHPLIFAKNPSNPC